jgi:hypothetical protein
VTLGPDFLRNQDTRKECGSRQRSGQDHSTSPAVGQVEGDIIIGEDIPDRSRQSLLQLMKLVVFCAVGFACVAPMVQNWQAGSIQQRKIQGLLVIALFESILVPLVWVGLSFLIVRRGIGRDRLILALLLFPLTVVLGIMCWILFAYNIQYHVNLLGSPNQRGRIVPLVGNIVAILLLFAAILILTLMLRRKLKTGR